MKNYYPWLNKIEIATESTFQCAGNLLRTRIFIKGVKNRLEISENTKILNYDIAIKGSDIGHWNAVGHELAGKMIASKLCEQLPSIATNQVQ
jgi:hypothetical protein